MQPYLFPYIGYFQLAHSVDEFWLLDTVNYVQHGWMNRNKVLVNGKDYLFTIPVNKHPRICPISEKVYADQAPKALEKLEKTLRASYAKAPHLDRAVHLVETVRGRLSEKAHAADFTDTTELALRLTFDAIGLHRPIHRVSSLDIPGDLKGEARIIAACQQLGAARYVNMAGGKELYDPAAFSAKGIELRFLEPSLVPYFQGQQDFAPGLSILDAVAWVDPADMPELYRRYSLS
ncbi:MAG: WbqC family protein [Pseudomonadota bacterium]|uniref:WbqC family protein n=1 Tax=Roseovarius salincola TaxID=2978479 RepID=UPI0022A6F155|nr:WbqC family protein [Roseovarius sp. EGI FJ00037]MCZ0811584.1 WbqC family protein [Roseovarius sp. EGI FJ00037]